jgi:uncharacterized membrane protein
MEELLQTLSTYTAYGVEAIAVIFIAFGAVQAAFLAIGEVVGLFPHPHDWRKDLFVRFGRWLLFGLQFSLAADIVRSVIAPTWNDIGQLAAIAVIRTFLNHFLEKELAEANFNAENKSTTGT